MGITIHYQGRLNPRVKIKEFHGLTKVLCLENRWTITDLEETTGKLQWSVQGASMPYEGKINEFIILPHNHCEPLNFQIGGNGFFQDRCKTQFAPVEIHVQIVRFFEDLKVKLVEMLIKDEGGYWETRDLARLKHNLDTCFSAIEKTRQESPDYYGPVRLEDGRIADLQK